MRSCQAASAALLPSLGRASGLFPFFTSQSATIPARFHLQPRYRAKLPLEATLLKVDASLDRFVTEKYADQIEAVLERWSAGLRESPGNPTAIRACLAADFMGTSWKAIDSRLVRSNVGIDVRRNRFAEKATLGRDAFVQEMQSAFGGFSTIHTAEFQMTGIDEPAQKQGAKVQTRVRYELVGSGDGFHREQRIGEWDLTWDLGSEQKSSDAALLSWLIREETQARSQAPIFVDIAAEAFAGNSSFERQLSHGSDYWRTTLDQACGIDIYGHNGVAVGDIDGDGFDDLYICQPAGLPNRLYRNRGDGTFDDITELSGLGLLENSACALFADFSNSGRQDLVVVRTDGPVLFINQGSGKFRKHPDAFRFAQPPQGTFTGAAVADYDRDGWLDIYFCLYLYYQGAEQYKYPLPYFDANNGPPNFLMRNQRDGTFRDVTAEAGLNQNNTRYSFCCAWLASERGPDLYVVNDFGRKNLYRNQGDGTFRDIAEAAGVTDVGAGMSVCALDFDNDGAEDLYVANMWTAAGERISSQKEFQPAAPEAVRAEFQKHSMGNSLFQRGSPASGEEPTFQSVGGRAGVDMGRWSWGSDSWDFDHDGFPDLYVTNGMVSGPSRKELNSFFWRQVAAKSPLQANPSHDYEQGWNALNELIRADGTWSGYERNVLYANNRDGTFSDVSAIAGMDFVQDGRSFALADLDHDGRLEVLLKNRNAPQVFLLKNVVKDLPPSIAIRLRGAKSNRDAIGAVVTIESSSGRQTRSLQAGSGFLAQHTKELLFGLGEANGLVQVSVRWPSGQVQQVRDLPQNHRIWIEEGKDDIRTEPFRPAATVRNGASAAKPEEWPETVETWLITPFPAPDFSLPDALGKTQSLSARRGKPLLLTFWVSDSTDCQKTLDILASNHERWSAQGLQLLAVNCDGISDSGANRQPKRLPFPAVQATDDVAGVYSVLYRYLFDRHRDLSLPTSFLVDGTGEIVKIYQGTLQAGRVEQDFQHIPRTQAERLAKALPFRGASDELDSQRNYLSFGSVFFQREYFDQAEASFRFALRDDPGSAEALYGLGSVFLKQQKRAEAHDAFQRATKLQAAYPDTLPNAWNNLGLIATQEGNTEEAIRCFREALRINPDHLIALDNLGNAFRQQKRWDEARQTFEHALAVSPEDPEANYSLGMVYAQHDDTQKAYEYLLRALQARPDYPEALNNVGVLYLKTGRRDQGVQSFEKCIQVAPEFDQAYLNLARVHALEGNTEEARNVLRELLKRHPDHAVAQRALRELGQ